MRTSDWDYDHEKVFNKSLIHLYLYLLSLIYIHNVIFKAVSRLRIRHALEQEYVCKHSNQRLHRATFAFANISVRALNVGR